MLELVQENMKRAQQKQKAWYDRNAWEREFQPSDEGLILLPTTTNKLLAQWQGPYLVLRQVGKVDYVIDMHDRRKRHHTFHVNMMHKWHEPAACLHCYGGCDRWAGWRGCARYGMEKKIQQPAILSLVTSWHLSNSMSSRGCWKNLLTSCRTNQDVLMQQSTLSIDTGTAQPVKLPPYRLPHERLCNERLTRCWRVGSLSLLRVSGRHLLFS